MRNGNVGLVCTCVDIYHTHTCWCSYVVYKSKRDGEGKEKIFI